MSGTKLLASLAGRPAFLHRAIDSLGQVPFVLYVQTSGAQRCPQPSAPRTGPPYHAFPCGPYLVDRHATENTGCISYVFFAEVHGTLPTFMRHATENNGQVSFAFLAAASEGWYAFSHLSTDVYGLVSVVLYAKAPEALHSLSPRATKNTGQVSLARYVKVFFRGHAQRV